MNEFAKPLMHSKTIQSLVATGVTYLAAKYGLSDLINALGGSEQAASFVTDAVIMVGGGLAGYFRFTATNQLFIKD